MNKAILIGRMTKDSELKYTQNELAVCDFTLAVDREYNKDETDFINCKAFSKIGETINKYTHKGDQLAVIGRINISSYEKDGKKVYTTNVVVENIKFLQVKKNEYEDMSVKTEQQQQFEIKPEDLPF